MNHFSVTRNFCLQDVALRQAAGCSMPRNPRWQSASKGRASACLEIVIGTPPRIIQFARSDVGFDLPIAFIGAALFEPTGESLN